MKTQREVFTGRQAWNVSTCDSESARWQIRFFFFELRQSEMEDFPPGRRKRWLLTLDDCLLAFYLPLLKQKDNLPQMTPYC